MIGHGNVILMLDYEYRFYLNTPSIPTYTMSVRVLLIHMYYLVRMLQCQHKKVCRIETVGSISSRRTHLGIREFEGITASTDISKHFVSLGVKYLSFPVVGSRPATTSDNFV